MPKELTLALFAAYRAGHDILRFLVEQSHPPRCLLLDSRDAAGLNGSIIHDSGIPAERIFYSDALDSERCLSSLKEMHLDLGILVWWPYLIRKQLLDIPRIGTLNLHPSYLPYNRGKHYHFWPIIEECPFGATIHFIDEGVDTGDIAFQTPLEITWEDTGESLYTRAQAELLRLFKEKFISIKSGNIPRIPQPQGKGSFHHSRELEEASKIDLGKTYSGRALLNLIRARTFWNGPSAWFVDGSHKYEVRIEIKRTDNA